MATNYETMYILRPDIGEEAVNAAIAKYQGILTEQGATDLEILNRGKRRLAQEIDRHREGVYVQMNYSAKGSAIAPMERAMRLSEEVIRYLTLKVEAKAKATEEAEAEEEATA